RYLRRIAARQPDAGSDAQLLERFFGKRDEAAFAELLDRHGPLVLAVCRRILQNFHDAEDVFQATFLVLARKGRSLRKRESLASWLHGVAFRIALKARAQAARRHAREQSLGDIPVVDSAPDLIWRDLRPILDEEVNRLPDKYRLPFVLCYLEGKTNEEASHVLGCPRGTIFSRLAWARQRLCRRLTGRGIVLSLAALDFALAGNAGSAAVPAQL